MPATNVTRPRPVSACRSAAPRPRRRRAECPRASGGPCHQARRRWVRVKTRDFSRRLHAAGRSWRSEIEAEFGPPPEPREEPAAPVLRETPRTPIEGSAASVRHPMPPQTPPPPVHHKMPSSPPREHVRERERLVDRLVAHPAAHGRDADEDVEIDIEPDPHRALRRRGYVIAGLIGCIVSQFVIFGLLTTRYWMG